MMAKKIFMLVLLFAFIGQIKAELIQHLDVTILDSITDNPVTEWADQSGSAAIYNATAAVGNVYYPSASLSGAGLAGLDFGAGRNTVQLFDAVEQDCWLNQTGGNGFCVLIVFKCDAVIGNWNDLVGNSSAVASGFGLRYSSSGAIQAYLGGKTINKGGSSIAPGDTVVYAFNYDALSRNYDFWDSRNDTVLSQTLGGVVTDFSLSKSVTLGSTTNKSRYFNGMVGEVRIFDSALSESEFQSERDGLVAKWITDVIDDTDPPEPTPATWASGPAAVSPFSIVMTATTGSDTTDVLYLFTETSGNPGGTGSNWQSSPVYQDDGLFPDTRYSYTVTMRDPVGNTGTASEVAYATTYDDSIPPEPNPATWASEPIAVNPFSIVMTATTGSDVAGVEYLFTETSGNPGGTSSNWQSSPSYRDDGLNPDTPYSYTITLRDTVGNTGMTSEVASAATPDTVPGRTSGPPNVVIIYADDLGNADISRNASPGSLSYTPHIDRICNEGVYLSNYMTHHVCSPSRAGLLTGRHYTRVGSGVETGGTLDNGIPNIARDFKAAGYATGCFGKWHNGSPPYSDDGSMVLVNRKSDIITDDLILQYLSGQGFGEGVNAYGFDEWAGYYGGGFDYHTRLDARDINWWINGVYSAHVTGYNTYIIRDNALDFIDTHASEPFFLYVPVEAVHAPMDILNTDLEEMCNIVDNAHPSLAWNNVKELVSPTTGNKIEDVVQMHCNNGAEFGMAELDAVLPGYANLVYYTLAYAMDKATGDILDRLIAHGLTENTIVVFASDNGGTSRADNSPFRGTKHTIWEGGIRVPAAIWWPGTFDADTSPYSVGDNEYEFLTQYFDLYPTLIAMAGQTLYGTDLDGLNLYPDLMARTPARTGFENCYYGLDDAWATVRNDRWKLHFNRVPGDNNVLELYDLQNDIGETTNVQDIYPAERDTLIALMDEWFATDDDVTASYMPLTGVSMPPYILPAPSDDILEVTATQTGTDGVFVRYADPDMGEFSEPYNGYVHAGDTFEYDIYVAADSDHISGFFCSPSFGPNPRFGDKRGVNMAGNLLIEQTLPKGQWIRQSTGMGEIAANRSYSSHLGLFNRSPGYYHFYIDNVVVRKKDGSIRCVTWKDAADTRSPLWYLQNGTTCRSWADVVASAGFSFSAITLTTVDLSTLPLDTTPPPAPESLTAQSGIGRITLDWADDEGQNGLAGYSVYRATTPAGYGTALAAGVQQSNYVDNNAVDGTKYYYRVTATDASGNESDNSNEDSALPPDLTDDDIIDSKDLAILSIEWQATYYLNDLLVIAENWLVN